MAKILNKQPILCNVETQHLWSPQVSVVQVSDAIQHVAYIYAFIHRCVYAHIYAPMHVSLSPPAFPSLPVLSLSLSLSLLYSLSLALSACI